MHSNIASGKRTLEEYKDNPFYTVELCSTHPFGAACICIAAKQCEVSDYRKNEFYDKLQQYVIGNDFLLHRACYEKDVDTIKFALKNKVNNYN